jgi:hypothetical protein
MQFLIEYLRETTEEHSVCFSRQVEVATLERARKEAWFGLLVARPPGATGFQIPDVRHAVVAIEDLRIQSESSTIH